MYNLCKHKFLDQSSRVREKIKEEGRKETITNTMCFTIGAK